MSGEKIEVQDFAGVLIVDDTPESIKLLSSILIKKGYVVRVAESGKLALQSIQANPPSLILLDVMMPEMDGFEVCRQLKTSEATRNIPVIFLSALDDHTSKTTGFQVGGVDYISKPFQLEEVLARVSTHYNLFRLQQELKRKNEELEHEIERHKRSKKALVESEKRLQLSLKVNNASVFENNFETGTVVSTPELYQFLGYEKDEMPITIDDLKKLTHPEDLPKVMANLSDHFAGNTAEYNCEFRITSKSGEWRWIDGRGKVIKWNEKGEPAVLLGISRDIHERKLAEDALRESENRYNSFFNADVDMIFVKDDKFRYLTANGAMANFFGKKEEELLYKTDQELASFGAVFSNQTSDQKAIDGNESFTYEEQLGDNIYEITKFPLYLAGDKKGIGGIIHDITEKKKALEAIQNERKLLRILIDNLPVTIYVKDKECRKIIANKADLEIIGKENEKEVLGKTDLELFNDEIGKRGYDDDMIVVNKGQAVINREEEFFDKKGLQHWLLTSKIPLFDQNGEPTGLVGIGRDITEQKIASETIHQEQQLLRTLIDHLPYPIYVKDKEGRKIVANRADCELVGSNYEADVLGKTDIELFDGETGQRGYNDDLRVIQTGNEIINEEELFFEKNGNVRWLLTSKIPLFDHRGKITGLVGVGRDITAQKASIEIIQHERQMLRTLIDNLPFAIYVKDNEARKLVANAADMKIMNCASESDFIGKTDMEIFHNDYERGGYDEDVRVLKTGRAMQNKEDSYFDTEGNLHWRVISKFPLFDDDGKITGLVGIGHDITDQRKANETILKLSKGIEQGSSSIIITDIKGNIEYINPIFLEITGYSKEEVLGKNPRLLKSGEMPAENYKELWKTISSGGVWRGELHNRKKNGELFWEWVTITSIKNEKGEIINYIAIKENIDLRKQMEADLIAAKEKAEENDRLKSAFLANMSHEIRTPLNCIIGFADLLSNPELEFDQEQSLEYAQLITASGNNLLVIINDIMDISKIEAGQVKVNKSNFVAQHLVYDVWRELDYRALEKGLKLSISSEIPKRNITIESDESKLRQVLINFIGNAIKFTEKGTIEIGLKANNESLFFYVKDTGIGIPKEYHENIFERFRQIEDSATRKYGGNGLGLAISKSLIEMLGGTIGMQSELGKGSTFYFYLPNKQ